MLDESYAVAPSAEKPEETKKTNIAPYVMILIILVALFFAWRLFGKNIIHV
jgi:hypothetical protein